MAEAKDSCVKPAKGPILPPEAIEAALEWSPRAKGGIEDARKSGKTSPDFEASAYTDGGFKNIKLSDYKGKWVVLCFYTPEDFCTIFV